MKAYILNFCLLLFGLPLSALCQGEADLWILYGGEMRFAPQFSWNPYPIQQDWNVFDKFTVNTCDGKLLFYSLRRQLNGGGTYILDSNHVNFTYSLVGSDLRMFPVKIQNNFYQLASTFSSSISNIYSPPALFSLNPGNTASLAVQDVEIYHSTNGSTITRKDSLYGHWFIYYSADSNKIVAMPFNDQGFDSAGLTHDIAPPIPWYIQPNRIEVAPSGEVIAMADYNANVLHLWQFIPQTGEWLNRLSISAGSIGPFGLHTRLLSLCFSRNSNKLYVKSSGQNIAGFFQLDLTQWDSTSILNSIQYISHPVKHFTWPTLAPDGNVYFNSFDYLSTVDSLFYGRLLNADSTYTPQNLEINVAGFKTYNGNIGYGDGQQNRLPWTSPYLLNPNRYSIVAQNFCFGDSTRLHLYDYQNLDSVAWDFGDGSSLSFDFAPTHLYSAPGAYTVAAYTRYCNRPDTLYYQLEILGLPQLPFADTSICSGDSLFLQLPANAHYSWSTGDTSASLVLSTPGIYSVNIHNGCFSATDSFELRIVEPANTYLPVDTGFCWGDSVWIDPGASVDSLLWPDGSRGPRWVNSPGNYTLELSNACGTVNHTISIGVYGTPPLNLNDTSICDGRVLRIDLPDYWQTNYVWQDGSTDHQRSLTDSGLYIVSAQNPCGSLTDSFQLAIRDCNCTLYLPNAFSPNNDGVNDEFKIISPCPLRDFELFIYDRWGQNIFHATNNAQAWDGNFQNKPLPTGAYAYVLHYTPEGGSQKVDSGVIMLIR